MVCVIAAHGGAWATAQLSTGVAVQVWAVKSYTKSAPLYVQCLRASSQALIKPFLDPMRDVIVSVEQTRHRLLALSCLCPGASTLLGAGPLSSVGHARHAGLPDADADVIRRWP